MSDQQFGKNIPKINSPNVQFDEAPCSELLRLAAFVNISQILGKLSCSKVLVEQALDFTTTASSAGAHSSCREIKNFIGSFCALDGNRFFNGLAINLMTSANDILTFFLSTW